MSHILCDSFDFYSVVAEAQGLWTSLGGMTLSATTRFGVGKCAISPAVSGTVGFSATHGQNAATMFLTFAHAQAAALGAAQNSFAIRLYDDVTVQCTIVFSIDGSINFYRGNSATLLGTYSGAFSGSGNWSHFQIKVILSNTVGEFHVRKNGGTADAYALTGVDNCSTANEYATKMDGVATATSSVQSFDDFWMYSGTAVAGEPSDWIGDVRAVQLMPNSDVTAVFSRSAGATNFSNVDELVNSETDYVFSSTAGDIDRYGNPGLTASPVAIKNVVVRAMGKKMDAGARTVGVRITSNAVTADSTAVAISSSTQTISGNFFTDPNTGAAWAAAALDAADFGPRIVT